MKSFRENKKYISRKSVRKLAGDKRHIDFPFTTLFPRSSSCFREVAFTFSSHFCKVLPFYPPAGCSFLKRAVFRLEEVRRTSQICAMCSIFLGKGGDTFWLPEETCSENLIRAKMFFFVLKKEICSAGNFRSCQCEWRSDRKGDTKGVRLFGNKNKMASAE